MTPPPPRGEARRASTFHLDDGATMSWLEFGEPEGRTALLVPGLTDGLAPIFHDQAAEAVPAPPPPFRHLRVLVVSHRRPLPEGWGTDDMARDVAAFAETVVGERSVAVGHSMGAMVVQHLAACRPDLVDRVVLSAAVPRADPDLAAVLSRWERLLTERRWREFHRDAIDVSFVGRERWKRRALLRLHTPPEPPAELVTRHLRLSAACCNHDARASVADVRSPTLIIAGADDQLTTPDASRDLAERMPDATFVELARAGHGLTEQRADAYAAAVAAFLGQP